MTSALVAAVLLGAVPAQETKVDSAAVDAAIRKGAAYLKGGLGTGKPEDWGKEDETSILDLLLYALLHAGCERDPHFQRAVQHMLKRRLSKTYCVAIQAMVLEELDRVKYQGRILQCAQFLVDNQNTDGSWWYGTPSPLVESMPSVAKDVATPRKEAVLDFDAPTPSFPRRKPKVVRRLPVQQKRTVDSRGDNSNSQYAALGLRACHDAGIVLPPEVIKRAQRWFLETQFTREGGWGYFRKDDGAAYGSMTVGAAGALAIYRHILNEPWKNDKAIVRGLDWVGRSFSVTANPGFGDRNAEGQRHFTHHYYYLYGLERLGVLYGTERIGKHDWYAEGAASLLKSQAADGSWGEKDAVRNGGSDTIDTCFAILFLKRATRPLVESVDRFKKE